MSKDEFEKKVIERTRSLQEQWDAASAVSLKHQKRGNALENCALDMYEQHKSLIESMQTTMKLLVAQSDHPESFQIPDVPDCPRWLKTIKEKRQKEA